MKKWTWDIRYISVDNLSESVLSVCQFTNGNCHIVIHRGCWAVVSQGVLMDRIFSTAAEALKQLPDNPNSYMPYVNFITYKKLTLA